MWFCSEHKQLAASDDRPPKSKMLTGEMKPDRRTDSKPPPPQFPWSSDERDDDRGTNTFNTYRERRLTLYTCARLLRIYLVILITHTCWRQCTVLSLLEFDVPLTPNVMCFRIRHCTANQMSLSSREMYSFVFKWCGIQIFSWKWAKSAYIILHIPQSSRQLTGHSIKLGQDCFLPHIGVFWRGWRREEQNRQWVLGTQRPLFCFPYRFSKFFCR